MIKVNINHHEGQSDFWYINESPYISMSVGKSGYTSKNKAADVTRQQPPYVNIETQD